MKHRMVCKIISALLCAISTATAVHYDYYMKWQRLGKDAFTTNQSSFYDTHVAGPTLESGILLSIVILVYIGIYEGLARILMVLTSRNEKHS
jgi:hypothetical protein